LQLKSTGKYLRLWFSGGLDSLLVLENACQMGIEFNEIVVSKTHMLGDIFFGSIAEQTVTGELWLKENSSRFPNTKITIYDAGDEEFEIVFSNPDWIRYTKKWYIHVGWHASYYYRFVDPVKTHLEKIDDRIDIAGPVLPNIYWEDGWKFYFIDYQWPHDDWPTQENFLVSNRFPEICHSYAHAFVNLCNQRGEKPTRFHNSSASARKISKQSIPEYARLPKPNPEFDFPKEWQDPWRPNDHPMWQHNLTYKTAFSVLMLYFQKPRKTFFKHYMDLTDWDLITKDKDFGGILSKTFNLEKTL
jgi:hypothetical protein